MIIDCPACRTKFSIDAHLLADVEDPRFHCSRCGHYFQLADLPLEHGSGEFGHAGLDRDSTSSGTRDLDSITIPTKSAEWVADTAEAERELLSAEPPKGEQLELIPDPPVETSITPDTTASEANAIFSAPIENRDSMLLVTAEWPETESSKVHEADFRGVMASEPPGVAPPAVETPLQAALAAQSQSTSGTESNGWAARTSSSSDWSTGFPASRAEATERRMPAPPPGLAAKHPAKDKETIAERVKAAFEQREQRRARRRAKRNDSYVKSMGELPISSSASASSGVVVREPRQSILETAPVLFIASAPLVLLLGFAALSSRLNSVPDGVAKIFHLSADHLPKIPPRGVEIIGLNSEVVTLDDGNKVLEVHGEVMNTTLASYENVRVETVLYDQQNTKLRSRVINVANALREAALPALHREAIEKLQDQPLETGGDPLGPHQKIYFRMVFTDLAGEERWLASRVYSVQRG